MIKINEIYPIDRKATYKTIADLESDYLSKFRVYTKPEDLLDNFISTRRSRKYRARASEINVVRHLKQEFADIILAKPKDLYLIIKDFESKGWDQLIYNAGETTKFGNELLHIFGYSERFRTKVGRGIWLAQQLNIKTCPYCNAQSTIVAPNAQGKAIAKFQFDHFFSKDKYPYLSISLYNLIPTCANCNITKSNKSLNLVDHYHPYHFDFSRSFKFHLKYNPDPKALNISQVKNENLEIDIVPKYKAPKGIVSAHNELYHLNGIYNRHQDIAEDLLIKAIVYNKHLINSHLKIKGLFPDRSSYLRYLIGGYISPDDILKRPLTKFTQDVARQLGLLK